MFRLQKRVGGGVANQSSERGKTISLTLKMTHRESENQFC